MVGSYYIPGKSDVKYVPSAFLRTGKAMFFLMHKDVKVAKFSMTKNGIAINVLEIYNEEHMPIGTRNFKQPILNQRFIAWKNGRCIPDNRPNIDKISEATGLTCREIETVNMGVSLNDCYWFKPIDTNYTWSDVNFYNNDYSNDVGNIVISNVIAPSINLKTPDTTTNGVLPKTWIKLNGKHFLLKVGTSKSNQEVCNEVFASLVAERLGLDTCQYFLSRLSDNRCCALCEDFIHDENVEFVSMQQVSVESETLGRNGVLNFLEQRGLSDAKDKMIVLDFLISNQDRHLGNFGIIRDASTLEVKGFAPLFDYDKSMNIGFWNSNEKSDIAKPFAYTHEEQLKLVENLKWVNLDGVKENYMSDIAAVYGEGGFDENEIAAMQHFFGERLLELEREVIKNQPEPLETKLSNMDIGDNFHNNKDNKDYEPIAKAGIENLDTMDMIEWEQS